MHQNHCKGIITIVRNNASFRRNADENCSLMGYYAASSVNSLPTFRDNLSVPSSGVKDSKENSDLKINKCKSLR